MTSELSHEFEADVAAGDFDSLGQKPDSRPRPDYYRGMGLLVLRGVRMVLLGLLVLHSVRMVLLGLFVLCGVSEWCYWACLCCVVCPNGVPAGVLLSLFGVVQWESLRLLGGIGKLDTWSGCHTTCTCCRFNIFRLSHLCLDILCFQATYEATLWAAALHAMAHPDEPNSRVHITLSVMFFVFRV